MDTSSPHSSTDCSSWWLPRIPKARYFVFLFIFYGISPLFWFGGGRLKRNKPFFELNSSFFNGSFFSSGSTIVWITVAFSLIFDVVFSVIILLEMEERLFPLGIVTYGLLERSISMILLIAYFTCMWLIFGEAKLANKGWFNTAAVLCLALAGTYLANFTLFLREWMREVRAAQDAEHLIHEEV